MRPLLLFLISISSHIAWTQTYDWAPKGEIISLPDSLAEEKAVILSSVIKMSYDSEAPELGQSYIEHKRIYLNSDHAIENNNRIYVEREESEDYEIKARVIRQDGTTIVLNQSDIKRGVDEESGIEYSYYAVEGLEIGSILETYTRIQTDPSFYGKLMYIQQVYPILDYSFEFEYPSHLEYRFKTYNTDWIGTEDKSEDKKTYILSKEYIPKYQTEEMAHKNANKIYLVYKLEKNYSRKAHDINGFGYFSQIIGDRALLVEESKSIKKALDKIYQDLPISTGMPDRAKVAAIENYIKTNYSYIDNNQESSLEQMQKILKQNALNSLGAIQLYTALLDRAGYTSSVAVTCNKSNYVFDKKFESYLILNKFLIYVKEIDLAIDPSDAVSRLSYFDNAFQGHDGLFISKREIGGIPTALGRVKHIPQSKPEENLTYTKIDVLIPGSFDDMTIKIEKSMYGKVAVNFQPLFSQVEDQYMDQFRSYVLYTHGEQYLPETVEFENTALEDFPVRPLISRYEVDNTNYWEKAGKKYILKLGDLIGPQSELYHNNSADRKFNIYSQFARRYQYDMSFEIPEGYEVVNLEDITFNITEDYEDVTFYFKSNYKITDNKVTITIDELYDLDTYPAAYFEKYQKVINAAADFNKVNIVFTPTITSND